MNIDEQRIEENLDQRWKQTLAIIGTVIISTGSVLFLYFTAQGAQDDKIRLANSKINSLCSSFVDLSNRMDQNIQNIGRAVKASVVTGSSANPCDQQTN